MTCVLVIDVRPRRQGGRNIGFDAVIVDVAVPGVEVLDAI
jgi:hypothetical protein